MVQSSKDLGATPAVRAGLAVGVAAAAYNLFLAVTGLYRNPALSWGVLAVELVGLVWILVTRGAPDRSFFSNARVGVLAAGAIAAVLAPATWFQWTYVAPDYADTILERARETWEASGLEAAEIEEGLEKLRPMYRPIRQAAYTFTGTMVTCLPMVVMIAGLLALGSRSRRPG